MMINSNKVSLSDISSRSPRTTIKDHLKINLLLENKPMKWEWKKQILVEVKSTNHSKLLNKKQISLSK